MPGDLPALTAHHDWERIIAGMTLYLIFHGATTNEHCKPLTVALLNAKQAMKFTQQQGLPQPKQRRSLAAPATEAWRAPTVQSVVNVLPQAASSCSTGECRLHHWTLMRTLMMRTHSTSPADALWCDALQ